MMRLLCIDEDPENIEFLEQVVSPSWTIQKVHTIADLDTAFRDFPFDMVFVDVDFCRGQGMATLPEIVRRQSPGPVIAFSSSAAIERVVRCMRHGAIDYVCKPFKAGEIVALFNRIQVFSHRVETSKRRSFKNEMEIIRAGCRNLSDDAAYPAPDEFGAILMSGEKGTGKYRLAREIHEIRFCSKEDHYALKHRFLSYGGSQRTAEQQHQDLFGTDLDIWKLGKSWPGIFERAGRGSVYISEIAAIKLDVQMEIFQMLEDARITRFMGRTSFPVFCKLIFASVYTLEELSCRGLIVPELSAYFLCRNFELRPLRERTDEIIPMAWYYLRTARTLFPYSKVHSFHPLALETITMHSWPENLRELRNSLLHAILNSNELQLGVADLYIPSLGINEERGSPQR